MVVVHGSLTIPTATGAVQRHATGVEDMNSKGYGDAFSDVVGNGVQTVYSAVPDSSTTFKETKTRGGDTLAV